jgi:hypothetical protein
MTVYVLDTSKNYQLQGGVTNGDWVELESAGNLWDRTGTVLSPTTSGDSISIGFDSEVTNGTEYIKFENSEVDLSGFGLGTLNFPTITPNTNSTLGTSPLLIHGGLAATNIDDEENTLSLININTTSHTLTAAEFSLDTSADPFVTLSTDLRLVDSESTYKSLTALGLTLGNGTASDQTMVTVENIETGSDRPYLYYSESFANSSTKGWAWRTPKTGDNAGLVTFSDSGTSAVIAAVLDDTKEAQLVMYQGSESNFLLSNIWKLIADTDGKLREWHYDPINGSQTNILVEKTGERTFYKPITIIDDLIIQSNQFSMTSAPLVHGGTDYDYNFLSGANDGAIVLVDKTTFNIVGVSQADEPVPSGANGVDDLGVALTNIFIGIHIYSTFYFKNSDFVGGTNPSPGTNDDDYVDTWFNSQVGITPTIDYYAESVWTANGNADYTWANPDSKAIVATYTTPPTLTLALGDVFSVDAGTGLTTADNLHITSNEYLDGNLDVTGDISAGGNLYVDTDTELNGNLIVNTDTDLGGDLTVYGISEFKDQVGIGVAASPGYSLQVWPDEDTPSGIGVNGAAYIGTTGGQLVYIERELQNAVSDNFGYTLLSQVINNADTVFTGSPNDKYISISGLGSSISSSVTQDAYGTGCSFNYSANNININNESIYSGDNDVALNHYGTQNQIDAYFELDSAGNTLTYTAYGNYVNMSVAQQETAGTIDSIYYGYYLSIFPNSPSITNGETTLYGLYLNGMSASPADYTAWGIWDDVAGANWRLDAIDKYVEFGDADVKIGSDDDGHLDLFADTSIDLNGNVEVGAASTETATFTSRLIVRTLDSDPKDATPANRPAGSTGEVAYYSGKLYICTDDSTPTWELITSS